MPYIESDVQGKRLLFKLCACIIIVAFIILSIIDFLEGDILEKRSIWQFY